MLLSRGLWHPRNAAQAGLERNWMFRLSLEYLEVEKIVEVALVDIATVDCIRLEKWADSLTEVAEWKCDAVLSNPLYLPNSFALAQRCCTVKNWSNLINTLSVVDPPVECVFAQIFLAGELLTGKNICFPSAKNLLPLVDVKAIVTLRDAMVHRTFVDNNQMVLELAKVDVVDLRKELVQLLHHVLAAIPRLYGTHMYLSGTHDRWWPIIQSQFNLESPRQPFITAESTAMASELQTYIQKENVDGMHHIVANMRDLHMV